MELSHAADGCLEEFQQMVSHQTINIEGHEPYGNRLPSQPLGELLRALPRAGSLAVRMALEGRSRGTSPLPWLSDSSDIRYLGHSGNSDSVLSLEVPRLGEAARSLYSQQELWDTQPNPQDTCLDLLGDVISDIDACNRDSERFDSSLLKLIETIQKNIGPWFHRLTFSGGREQIRPFQLSAKTLTEARQLSRETPRPQRVRLFGKLDMLRSSTNSLALKLIDGQEVRGALNSGNIRDAGSLLGKDVLLLGMAVYRPSGKILRIDVDELHSASTEDRFFGKLPTPKRPRIDIRNLAKEQPGKRGVAAIIGQWPGNETLEEIERTMREMG